MALDAIDHGHGSSPTNVSGTVFSAVFSCTAFTFSMKGSLLSHIVGGGCRGTVGLFGQKMVL